MRTVTAVVLLGASLVLGGCETYGGTGSSRNEVISVQYGVVEDMRRAQVDANVGQGATLGGLLGLAAAAGTGGSRSQQVAGTAAGALIGGLVQNQRAANNQAEEYTVRLNNGNTVRIATVHHDIQVGDCVSVEQGRHANLRRVSPVMCESMASADAPGYAAMHSANMAEAEECERAKQEVLNATTEDEVRIAHQKMRALCEA